MTTLKEITGKIPHVAEVPAGYLSLQEYADRVPVAKQVLQRAIINGRISERHLIAQRLKSRVRLYIHWDNSAYDYVSGMRDKWQPEDFESNPQKIYKPLAPPVETLPPVDPGDPLTSDEMAFEKVQDLTSAKYRREQINIAKEQVALQLAKNMVVSRDVVEGTQRQLAQELKAALKSFVQRMAPVVTACSSVVENRAHLDRGIAEALLTLEVDEDE